MVVLGSQGRRDRNNNEGGGDDGNLVAGAVDRLVNFVNTPVPGFFIPGEGSHVVWGFPLALMLSSVVYFQSFVSSLTLVVCFGAYSTLGRTLVIDDEDQLDSTTSSAAQNANEVNSMEDERNGVDLFSLFAAIVTTSLLLPPTTDQTSNIVLTDLAGPNVNLLAVLVSFPLFMAGFRFASNLVGQKDPGNSIRGTSEEEEGEQRRPSYEQQLMDLWDDQLKRDKDRDS